jgi:hypothetical protein
MNGQAAQSPSWPPETPVSVILTLATWNTVLGCVAKQPWEIADPLMQTIRQQIADELHPTVPPAADRPATRAVPTQSQSN